MMELILTGMLLDCDTFNAFFFLSSVLAFFDYFSLLGIILMCKWIEA